MQHSARGSTRKAPTTTAPALCLASAVTTDFPQDKGPPLGGPFYLLLTAKPLRADRNVVAVAVVVIQEFDEAVDESAEDDGRDNIGRCR